MDAWMLVTIYLINMRDLYAVMKFYIVLHLYLSFLVLCIYCVNGFLSKFLFFIYFTFVNALLGGHMTIVKYCNLAFFHLLVSSTEEYSMLHIIPPNAINYVDLSVQNCCPSLPVPYIKCYHVLEKEIILDWFPSLY